MEGPLGIIQSQALILQMKKLKTRGKGLPHSQRSPWSKAEFGLGAMILRSKPALLHSDSPAQTGPFRGRFISPFLTSAVTELRNCITDPPLVGLQDCLQVSQQLAKVTVDFINHLSRIYSITKNKTHFQSKKIISVTEVCAPLLGVYRNIWCFAILIL